MSSCIFACSAQEFQFDQYKPRYVASYRSRISFRASLALPMSLLEDPEVPEGNVNCTDRSGPSNQPVSRVLVIMSIIQGSAQGDFASNFQRVRTLLTLSVRRVAGVDLVQIFISKSTYVVCPSFRFGDTSFANISYSGRMHSILDFSRIFGCLMPNVIAF
jgi:hypothetical protein